MTKSKLKKAILVGQPLIYFADIYLLHFLYNCAECSRVVHCKVGKDFAVDFDVRGLQLAHKLGVGETFGTNGSIDTLNP